MKLERILDIKSVDAGLNINRFQRLYEHINKNEIEKQHLRICLRRRTEEVGLIKQIAAVTIGPVDCQTPIVKKLQAELREATLEILQLKGQIAASEKDQSRHLSEMAEIMDEL